MVDASVPRAEALGYNLSRFQREDLFLAFQL